MSTVSNIPGRNIQRTMHLLATSTPLKRNTVKILIYGQSLSKQEWAVMVIDDLRRRFPHADIVAKNLSVGGFAAQMLIHTAEMDVYPFNPDLIILHVFGGEPEKEMLIRNLRTRTTAELLLQSDHITWRPSGTDDNPDAVKGYEWHNQHATVWLPAMCTRYGCELADVRGEWMRYLADHPVDPRSLTTDGSHFNAEGNALMSRIVCDALVYKPELGAGDQNAVTTLIVGKAVRWQCGQLELPFEGTRIEAIGTGLPAQADVRVMIDGQPPSANPALYGVTRPNGNSGKDWPWKVGAMYRVTWNTPLVLEDWTVTITEIGDDYNDFRFSVKGSITGADGEGRSTDDFVSLSGRVVIGSKFWHLQRAREVVKLHVENGYEIRWSVVAQFADQVRISGGVDPAIETVALIASGLENTRHTLILTCDNPAGSGIAGVRVFRPLRFDDVAG